MRRTLPRLALLVLAMALTVFGVNRLLSPKDTEGSGTTPPPTPQTPTRTIPTDLAPLIPDAAHAYPGSQRTLSKPATTREGFECLGAGNATALRTTAPGIRVDYLVPTVEQLGIAGNANIHFTIGRYVTPSEQAIRTLWTSAPAVCGNSDDHGEAYDNFTSEWVKGRAFDGLVAPSLVYQARLTPRDAGYGEPVIAATSLYAVSNGWYLIARDERPQDLLEQVVPIVAASLDAKLGTHFMAGPEDDYSDQGTPQAPVDHISKTAFTYLVRDPDCELVTMVPNGQSVFRDITGDGYVDAMVSYSCISPTSSWPATVYVFDGRHSRGQRPRQIATLPTDPRHNLYLRDIRLTVTGQTIAIKAGVLSKSAHLCCSDQKLEQRFTWSGDRFIAGPAKLTKLY